MEELHSPVLSDVWFTEWGEWGIWLRGGAVYLKNRLKCISLLFAWRINIFSELESVWLDVQGGYVRLASVSVHQKSHPLQQPHVMEGQGYPWACPVPAIVPYMRMNPQVLLQSQIRGFWWGLPIQRPTAYWPCWLARPESWFNQISLPTQSWYKLAQQSAMVLSQVMLLAYG